jgi:tetratricopeptide (TPR) repeat protein
MAGQAVPLVSDLLYRLGTAKARRGETSEAETLFHQSLEVATWCGYPKGQAYAVNCLAVVAQRRGDLQLAESQYRRAVRLANEAAEFRLTGMVEQNLGVMASVRGDLDSAEVHYRKSLRAFEQAGDMEGVCWVLNNLGMLEIDLGRFGDAEATLTRGLKLARKRKDSATEGLFEVNRVEALIGSGKWRTARRRCKRVFTIAKERGDGLLKAEGLKLQAIIERERGKLELALEYLSEARDLAHEGQDALLHAEVLREMGETKRSTGDFARARTLWEDALSRFESLDATLDAADMRERLEQLGGSA